MPQHSDFAIDTIEFMSGERAGGEPLILENLGRIVIFVGPNNSGKSTALSEIGFHLGKKTPPPWQPKIVRKVSIRCPDKLTTLWEMLGNLYPIEYDEKVCRLAETGSDTAEPIEIRVGNVDNALNEFRGHNRVHNLVQYLLRHLVFRHGAADRLKVFQRPRLGNLRGPPTSFIDRLFREPELRGLVDKACRNVFGLHFVIDQLGEAFDVRLGLDPPPPDLERIRFLDGEIRQYLDAAQSVLRFGDGIQAFTSIMALLAASGYKFVLLDDPEAYLHPPTARRLGSELVRIVLQRDFQLFVNTHSPDFLMGCIEASSDVRIIRLTYDMRKGRGTAREIRPSSLDRILHDRLLRSTGVFAALFHRAAVVVESEEDRVFYDEINRRLVEVNRGSPDTVFINAQNWQTTGEIAAPLRESGIPTLVFLDVDVLLRPMSEWKHIKRACGISLETKDQMVHLRTELRKSLSDFEEFKTYGLDALDDKLIEKTETVIENLGLHGIFIVPGGALESWLPQLGVEGSGSSWVRRVSDRMGATEDSSNYLYPDEDDVWMFVDSAATWVEDALQEEKSGL